MGQFAVKVAWFGEAAVRLGSALDSAWFDSSRAKRHQVQGDDLEQPTIEALDMAS